MTRKVKNERHVSHGEFPAAHPVLARIREHGMSFWFQPNPGYNLDLVREFYRNMIPPANADLGVAEDAVIVSNVGKNQVVIDRDAVAKALGYRRPRRECNFPFSNVDEDFLRVVNYELYGGKAEHVDRHFVDTDPHEVGDFTSDYRLLNQIIMYNILPSCTESKPTVEGGVIMYAFMQSEFVADWADFIFEQICLFKGFTSQKTRIPYPCLITSICRDQNFPAKKVKPTALLSPGIITMKTVNMSDAQVKRKASRPSSSRPSSGQPTDVGPSVGQSSGAGPSGGPSGLASSSRRRSLLEKPSKGTHWKKLLSRLVCNDIAIMNCLKKDKAERRAMARRIETDHAWHRRQLELQGVATEPYDPEPLVTREPSDDFIAPDDEDSD